MNPNNYHSIKESILEEVENELDYFLRDVKYRVNQVIKEVYSEIEDSRRCFNTLSLQISKSNSNKRFALTLLEKICDDRVSKLNGLEEEWHDDYIEELVTETDSYKIYELFRGGDSPDVVKDYIAHDNLREQMENLKINEEFCEILSDLFDKIKKTVAA